LAKVRVYLRMQSIREAQKFEHDVLGSIYNKTQRTIGAVMQSVQKLDCDEEIDANERKAAVESVNEAFRDLQDFFIGVAPETVLSQESVCELQGSSL